MVSELSLLKNSCIKVIKANYTNNLVVLLEQASVQKLSLLIVVYIEVLTLLMCGNDSTNIFVESQLAKKSIDLYPMTFPNPLSALQKQICIMNKFIFVLVMNLI